AEVPEEPRAFWSRHFPEMTSVEENVKIARECGYVVLDWFALPPEAWWNYYGPLRDRVRELRVDHGGHPHAAAALDQTDEEIAMYERFGSSYGYVFYVLKRSLA